MDGVTSATVDLALETATIEMDHHIDVSSLQAALPEKFSISEIIPQALPKEELAVFKTTAQENELSKFQQLKPLFLIFGFIIILVIATNFKAWNLDEAMLDFMGTFLLIFSLFKFFDLKGFATSFKMYDPLAKVVPVYSKIYPFIEATLGVLLLARVEIPIVLLVTILILVITTIGVTQSLLRKKTIQCACLGTVLKLPMTQATFIENAIMIIMAITLIIKTNLL